MINLELGVMTRLQRDKMFQPIKEWVVGFIAGNGIHYDLADAVKYCEENNLSCDTIRTVAVAIGEDGYSEPA